MTKKLIILFVAMGVTYFGHAQGYGRGFASLTDTPAAAFSAQTPPVFAIRTNLVYWATMVPQVTPNFGIEFGLSPKLTFNLTGAYNPFNPEWSTVDTKKLAHWDVVPEIKYWFCERFNGSAIGIHGIYGGYNVAGYGIPLLFEEGYRYEGSAFGAGISYNYHWMLGKRFGLEFTLGGGFLYMKYEKSTAPCSDCEEFKKTYLGPTKIGINLIYLIK